MAERVCSKCGQAMPEAKAEGRIVELAVSAGWTTEIGSATLEVFRAIQAELDNNNALFAGLHEHEIPELAQKIRSMQELFRNHEKRLKDLEPGKPKPLPCYPTDRNGHRLIPGRSVVRGPFVEMLFLGPTKEGGLLGYTSTEDYARNPDHTWESSPERVTWLFDLDLDERGDC